MALSTISGTTGITDATITSAKLADFSAAVDLNGVELLLDADQDTSISADTDDQIDIKIGGADDFQFTANTFTALSGSTIKANTIAETTSTSGVTIDGVLLKDGVLGANTVDSDAYVDGSIDLAHMSSESVDEDNLYISNAGSNGQFLSKQSGNNGGLTWASAALAGIDDQSSSNDDQLTITDTAIIINEDSDDLDFRIESDNDTHALFVQGSDGSIGLGTSTPAITSGQQSGKFVTLYNTGTNGSILELASNKNTDNNDVGIVSFVNTENANDAAGTRRYIAQIRGKVETDDSNAGDDSGGNLVFQTKANGGAIDNTMTLEAGADVIVERGDLIFGTAGKGIVLGATSNTDANTLDDYEEGTWTPSIVSGSGLSIGTVHQNRYTKIGRVVSLNASFNINSSSVPGSGGVRIGGFPFAMSSFDNGGFPIDIHYNYKQTPCAFISSAGWMYYQNTTVGGNNQQDLGNALDAVNVISLIYSYVTT